MSNDRIKVVTFDLDDTLWDVKPVLQSAEQQVFDWLEQHAPKVTQQFSMQSFMQWRWEIYQRQPELAHQISQLRITAVRQAMEWVGYNPVQAAHMAQQAFDVFLQCRHQVIFFDSVKPMLNTLSGHYQLGVLTNGNADIFKLEMGEFFDFSFSAEQLNASKPAADHFLAAQQFCNTQPQQMVHIGDHIEHDVTAASNAGWHAVWYNPEQKTVTTNTELRQVRSLDELPELIATIDSQFK